MRERERERERTLASAAFLSRSFERKNIGK